MRPDTGPGGYSRLGFLGVNAEVYFPPGCSAYAKFVLVYPVGYNKTMYSVIETEEFAQWMASLRDTPTRIRLQRRLGKASRGNLGDVKPVGGDVYEMREFFGPGWRMYYVKQGAAIILMLGGGDKATQDRDIERAKAMALELQNEQDQDPPV